MAPFRMIPHALWLREHRRHKWLAQFLCEVDFDQLQYGKPKSIRFYAARFDANRKTIRRFLDARKRELAACTTSRSDGTTTGPGRDRIS